MYEYKAKITRIVDGDTCDCLIDLGFSIHISERIRVMGIDTPESRTRNLAEKKLGLAAKARFKELCKEAKNLCVVKTTKDGKGKFGRILADIILETQSLGKISIVETLIAEGHARPYSGGKKVPWV